MAFAVSSYGLWEWTIFMLIKGLINASINFALYASGDSDTKAKIHFICHKDYENNPNILPKVWECLHISEIFECAHEFNLIHKHFDFLLLANSNLVKTPVLTTIYGFSSSKMLLVDKKYNQSGYYVSTREANRAPSLDYLTTI